MNNLFAKLTLILCSLILWLPITAVYADQSPPFAVASKTIFITDSTRPWDSVENINTGQRLIIFEMWYPIAKKDASGHITQWLDYFRDAVSNPASPVDTSTLSYAAKAYNQTIINYQTTSNVLRGAISSFAPLPLPPLTSLSAFMVDPINPQNSVCDPSHQQYGACVFFSSRNSFRNKPLLVSSSPYPVIIYTPGVRMFRMANDLMAVTLAAQGYIVIGMDNVGYSTSTPIGRDTDFLTNPAVSPANLASIPCDPVSICYDPTSGIYGSRVFLSNQPLLETSALQQIADMQAILNWLKSNAADQNLGVANNVRFANISKIGVIGHSYGGLTSAVASRLLPGVAAAMSLDGIMEPRHFFNYTIPGTVNAALFSASGGAITSFNFYNKPIIFLRGNEDDVAMGAVNFFNAIYPSVPAPYDPPSAANPVSYDLDNFNIANNATVLLSIAVADHDDVTDFPADQYLFPNAGRPQAFMPTQTYTANIPEIHLTRDLYASALFNAYLKGQCLQTIVFLFNGTVADVNVMSKHILGSCSH